MNYNPDASRPVRITLPENTSMLHDSPQRIVARTSASSVLGGRKHLLVRVAEFISGIKRDSMPQRVVEKVKCHLLYTLCNAVAGGSVPDPLAPAVAAARNAPGACMAWGTSGTGEVGGIAFLNAVTGAYRAQNDFEPGSATHPGCVVVPAILALAQSRQVGGAKVLESVVAGYELCTRLAAPAAQVLAARGQRPTAVFGAMAASAAAARLIGLDALQTGHAIGIASQTASGTMQCWTEGTPEWRLQFGMAAEAGIRAALLAERGVEAAKSALDGDHGLYRAIVGSVPDLEFEGWSILDVYLQAFPGSAAIQPALEALALLASQGRLGPSAGAIEVVFPEGTGFRGPAMHARGPFYTSDEALASLPYMAAVLLLHGVEGLSDWRNYVHSGNLAQVSSRIVLRAGGNAQGSAVRIGIDGAAPLPVAQANSIPKGEWDKTVALLAPSVHAWRLTRRNDRFLALANSVLGLEQLDRIDHLLELLRPDTPPTSAMLSHEGIQHG